MRLFSLDKAHMRFVCVCVYVGKGGGGKGEPLRDLRYKDLSLPDKIATRILPNNYIYYDHDILILIIGGKLRQT